MKKRLQTFLFWFILIQPFLDIYWLSRPPLLKFSIPTILRVLGVFIAIILFFSIKNNWQRFRKQWWIIAYIGILILYSIFHLISVRNFTGVDATGFHYSPKVEIFYLVRACLPLIVIYITSYSDFKAKYFFRVIQGISGIYSLTIVISNLFLFSLTSYHTTEAKRISANIFSWFTQTDYPFNALASKGIFFQANTLSAILFMIMPIMLYILYKEFNLLNIVLVSAQALAMLMLGTKVGNFGLIISLVVFLLIFLIHSLILKNTKFSAKFLITLICILTASAAIFPYSPTLRRSSLESGVAQKRSNLGDKKRLDQELNAGLERYKGKKQEDYLKEFIKKNYWVYSLKHDLVLEHYTYQNDPYYWLEVMKRPANERLNYRHLEKDILSRVMKTDKNKSNKLFGISFSRENNIAPLERDFLAQYYSMGILGVILLDVIYLFVLGYGIFYWLFNKKVRSFLNSSLLLSEGFILFAAFYAGNVLEYLSATLVMAFILGFLLQNIRYSRYSEISSK
ncbi:O-antigen ligase family protein [Lactobacillus johnsonii]|uniref:O-antigen ligase family protein n=1 Tax=Lactobacillus johnsonii TaxID=33959 RepID=UPI0026030EE3